MLYVNKKKISSVFKKAYVLGHFCKFSYVKEIIRPIGNVVSASELLIILPSIQSRTVKLRGKTYVDIFGYMKLSQASQRANKDNFQLLSLEKRCYLNILSNNNGI